MGDGIGLRAVLLLTVAMVAACGKGSVAKNDQSNASSGGQTVKHDYDTIGPKSFRGMDLSAYDILAYYPSRIPTMKVDEATGETIDLVTGEVLSSMKLNSMGQNFEAVISKDGQTILYLRGHVGTGFKPGFGKTKAIVVTTVQRGGVLDPRQGALSRNELKLDHIADFLGNNARAIRFAAGNTVVLDGRGAHVRYPEF